MKIVADECIPPRAFEAFCRLLDLRKPPARIRGGVHLLQLIKEGEGKDDVWVPKLASLRTEVVVLTTDHGVKQPRLPEILPAYQVPAIFFAPKFAQLTGFEKIRAVLCLLPNIEAAVTAGKLRSKIVRVGSAFKLKDWPLSAPTAAPDRSAPPSPPAPPGG